LCVLHNGVCLVQSSETELNFTFCKSQKVTRPLDIEHVKNIIIIKYDYTRDISRILVKNINLQETFEDSSTKYKYTRDSRYAYDKDSYKERQINISKCPVDANMTNIYIYIYIYIYILKSEI